MRPAEPRPLILSSGERLGGYSVDEVLGIGGMAVVYRATQHSLRRTVALKVLDRRLSEQDGFRERFQREGALVASLDHPNIVPVYDQGEDDGRLYLAMRFVEGETLADRMHRGGLTAEETGRILEQIGSALDLAHGAGVLHRDVKPQNILLAGDRPYLADFGVAKSAEASTATGTGGFLGSVHYASPEQIRGDRVDGRTDLYSLAAVAFECLTGRAPFTSPSEVGVMHAHLEQPPPPLPGRLGSGARELSRVLAAGLAKVPADRPATAGAFAAELGAAVRRLTRDERTRRPAFPIAPEPAGAPVASHPGARDETVDLAAAIAGPGQSQTVDLTTAREGGTPGATV
jgi:serine/threonine protein kinase